MKKIIIPMQWLVCLCTVCLGSCGNGNRQNPQTANYKTLTVATSNIDLSSRYTASVKGKENVDIRPQVSGLITEIRINEGQKVCKGQVLFVIDQVPYQAALHTAEAKVESAEAKVATAQLTADSKKELFKENVISEYDLQTALNDLQEAKALLSQARAELVNAENNLSYTYVKSPSDGVTGMIPYKVGTLVSSSIEKPLVTVASEDEMFAYFSITENQLTDYIRQYGSLDNLMKNMPAVSLELGNGVMYDLKGQIDAVSGTVDDRTGAVMMRALFLNPNRLLRNGGRATILLPHKKTNCIVVPQSATFEVQDKKYVYKVIDGKAVSTPVQTFGVDDGKSFIVETGLDIGDVIIAEGAGLVREGTTVNTGEHQMEQEVEK